MKLLPEDHHLVDFEPLPPAEASPSASGTDFSEAKDAEVAADMMPKPKPRRSRRIEQKTFPDTPRTAHYPTPTTIENVAYMLMQAGITVRYNVIKKKLEISVPGHCGTADNRDNATMSAILSLASLNGLAVGLVPQFVEVIGDVNAYNPVADWINSASWDGCDRLQALYDTVQTAPYYPIEMKEVLLRKWLLSAVAAVIKPDFRTRGVLTLQGPQGAGKTSWVLSLVSDPELRAQCVKVDHHLDSSNKDSIIGAITHWLVEVGELDSSFKKDVARLKGFLTANFDKVRRPYARVDAEYPRRTVFIATVNEKNFLVDTTGNSRFWTIAVQKLDFNHGINMQQLYAQLAVQLAAGAEWWLTDDEEAQVAQLNAPHQSISVIEDLVLAHYDDSLKDRADNPALTASDLLRRLGIEKPTNGQAKECATVLRGLLGDSRRIKGRDIWSFPGTMRNGEHGESMVKPEEAAKGHKWQR